MFARGDQTGNGTEVIHKSLLQKTNKSPLGGDYIETPACCWSIRFPSVPMVWLLTQVEVGSIVAFDRWLSIFSTVYIYGGGCSGEVGTHGAKKHESDKDRKHIHERTRHKRAHADVPCAKFFAATGSWARNQADPTWPARYAAYVQSVQVTQKFGQDTE